MKQQPVLQLDHIYQAFPEGKALTIALEDISLKITPGEFFVMIGPSGCGKSTLLRIMSGLDKPAKGIFTLGDSIQPGEVAFVFQQFALLPWLTVAENVELGILNKGLSVGQREKRVKEQLKKLGLTKFATSYPHELSGGMRQRVGLARAFAIKPKLIFMDEPFSELDTFTAETLREELLRMWADERPTIVLVTHLIYEAIQLADRIAVLTPRPGRIQKLITNPLPRPRNRRSKEFFDLEDKLENLLRKS